MTVPTEPIPGASPTPPTEQPSGATQARQEFFKQSPIGPAGNADRTAAVFGMPTAKPEVSQQPIGPQPILTTEPHQDSSVDPDAPTQPYTAAELGQIATNNPTNKMRDIAAASMISGIDGDSLSTSAVPYVPPQPEQIPAQPQPAPTEPTLAPKKPWWKIW